MTNLEALKLMLKISSTGEDNFLTFLLEKAEKYILNKTNRDTIPAKLAGLPVDMAVVDYNRLGTQGDKARTEGEISQTFSSDYPDNILSQIKPFVKVGVINAITT